MNRYVWNVTGLSEVRWERYGEKAKDDGHTFRYSGRQTNMNMVSDFLCMKVPSIRYWDSIPSLALSAPYD